MNDQIILKAEKTESNEAVVITCMNLAIYNKMTDKQQKAVKAEDTIKLYVGNTIVNNSMKQDDLTFPMVRQLVRKRGLQLTLPEGATIVAHEADEAYGESGAIYKASGHHITLPTDEEGNITEFMSIEAVDSEEATDLFWRLPQNRQFIPLGDNDAFEQSGDF